MTYSDSTAFVLIFTSNQSILTDLENIPSSPPLKLEKISEATHFGEQMIKENRPGEAVTGGQNSNLMKYLSKTQPRLLIFEKENEQIPYSYWIPLLKSSAATRRIPIMILYQEATPSQIDKIKQDGADLILSLSAFQENSQQLVLQSLRKTDQEAINASAELPLSDLALAGITLFNEGEYYEAHHGLEDAWNGEKGPGREIYRALLQISVAYLQIERNNYRGAAKMFLRLQQWLAPFPDQTRGIDLAQLRADVATVHEALLAGGQDNIESFDHTMFRPIPFITES